MEYLYLTINVLDGIKLRLLVDCNEEWHREFYGFNDKKI